MFLNYLDKHKEISAKQAQKVWGVTVRTTTTRLKKMSEKGLIIEVSTGPYDPHKTFVKPRSPYFLGLNKETLGSQNQILGLRAV